MTSLLQTILIRVTIAGIASAVALRLSGEGAMRETVRLSAGLLMLLALLQPLSQLRVTGILDQWKQENVPVNELEENNMQTVMSTVAANIANTLEERASEIGIDCDVRVTMANDDKGILQISGVSVYYRESDAGRLDELRTLLSDECGVDEERQELIQR